MNQNFRIHYSRYNDCQMLMPLSELSGFERNKNKGVEDKIFLFSLGKQNFSTQRELANLNKTTS